MSTPASEPQEPPVEVEVKPPPAPAQPPEQETRREPVPTPADPRPAPPVVEPAPAPAPTPEQTPTVALAPLPPVPEIPPPPRGPVTVEVAPQYGLVLAGTSPHANILIRLTGTKEVAQRRQPLDLALVIDRSGSMRGDKIRKVKQAAIDLVDKLDDGDRVTLVTYDHHVTVVEKRRVADQPGRAALKARLLEVRAGGRTALGPALFKSLEILEGAERGETHIPHIILFSDGLANVGETRPKVISARSATAFARGVSVSTLGVGLDYNEDLMTQVADQGGGRYHFIKEASAIAGVLNDEFSGLSSTVARGIVLDLRPAPGARVTRVFGYASSEENSMTSIKVGTLYAGQTREILVQVDLPPATGDQAPVGTLLYRLRDVTADGAELVAEIAVKLGVSNSPEEVQKSERSEVSVRVAEVESAQELDKVARAVNRGEYQAAKGMLSSSLGRLREQNKATPSPKLDAQIADMEEAFNGVDAAKSSSRARREFIKEKKAQSYNDMK